jgi:hypothetical protein
MSHKIIKRRAKENIRVLILTPVMKRKMRLIKIKIVRVFDILQVVLINNFNGVLNIRIKLIKDI